MYNTWETGDNVPDFVFENNRIREKECDERVSSLLSYQDVIIIVIAYAGRTIGTVRFVRKSNRELANKTSRVSHRTYYIIVITVVKT